MEQNENKEPNENITAEERLLVDLVLGFRAPIGEKEKELAKQIKEIHDKGRTVEIPNVIF